MRVYTKPKYGIQEDLQEWHEYMTEKKEKEERYFRIFVKKLSNPYTPDFLGRIKIFLN